MNYPDTRVEVSMVNNLPLPLRVFSYPRERDGRPLSASPFPPYQWGCLTCCDERQHGERQGGHQRIWFYLDASIGEFFRLKSFHE